VAEALKVTKSGDMMINAAFAELLEKNDLTSVEKIFQLQGETVKKAVKQRGTARIFLTGTDGQPLECYIKRCTAIPLSEKIKCFFQLKRWNFDSVNEWQALLRFHELGLKTMLPIAAGRLPDGSNCLLTLGLTGCVRASDFFADENVSDADREKAITEIAQLTASMHNGGMTHQDLYMVHFFLRPKEDFAAYMIDLQRVIFKFPPRWRWHVKDLGQLKFAAEKLLNSQEMTNLFKIYQENCVVNRVYSAVFEKAVAAKAAKIDQHDASRARRRAAAENKK
jgi:lipopolysaccharide core heptose(I) kinase